MLRFILNFILFGILFYLIYVYFPDTFLTLVSWADQIYTFFKELFIQLYEKMQSVKIPEAQEKNATALLAILLNCKIC